MSAFAILHGLDIVVMWKQEALPNTYVFSLCFFATFVLDVFFTLVGMFCLDFLINLFASIYGLEKGPITQRNLKRTQYEIGERVNTASDYIRSRRSGATLQRWRLETAETCCYRRMLQISWTETWTNKRILGELQTRREPLGIGQIIKRKLAFFGHACINKTCIIGSMSRKRRRRRPMIHAWLITSRSGQ